MRAGYKWPIACPVLHVRRSESSPRCHWLLMKTEIRGDHGGQAGGRSGSGGADCWQDDLCYQERAWHSPTQGQQEIIIERLAAARRLCGPQRGTEWSRETISTCRYEPGQQEDELQDPLEQIWCQNAPEISCLIQVWLPKTSSINRHL